MVNQEILGGLKSAMANGDSLEKSMMTLYNAGYKRGEIEEAARLIHQQTFQPAQMPVTKPVKKSKGLFGRKKKVKPVAMPQKVSPKKISSYGAVKKPKKKAGKWFMIAFLVLGLIFIGLLIAFVLSN